VLVLVAALDVLPYSVGSRYAYIVGVALILSDVLHHAALVPLLRRYRYDVRMVHHETAHRYLVRWSAVLLIAIGVLALLTPFTPGSWLFPVGFISLVGTRRARAIARSLFGVRGYRRLQLDRFFRP
jgi:small-conductance mechanosensitive channel